jgi:Tol biopolymer transport system component
VWLHDGTGLVFSATQPGETENQLWLISYPDGRVKRITNDLHHYASTAFGVSRDDAIAIGQYVNFGDVSVSDPTGGNPIRVTGGSSLDSVIGWAGNGRLVYSSAAPVRSLRTWSPGSGPGSPRKAPVDLTDIGGMFPAPGRDWIVYTNPGARPDIDIWRMNLDGTGRQQLTHTGHNVNPRVTPDGEWILYANWESGVPDTWKVPAAGGTPELLNKRTGAPTPVPIVSATWP